MTDDATHLLLPTAKGFAARLALATLQARGVAAGSLLKRAKLAERDLNDRQARISAAGQSRFLEYSAEALDDSAFGLHLAEGANPREAGLLFYVASAAKDLRGACREYVRYFRLSNEAIRPTVSSTLEGAAFQVHYIGFSRHQAQQNVEFGVALLLKSVRDVTGRQIRPIRTTFTHRRQSDLREFDRYFGCPVEFAAPADQLVFSNEALALPLVTEDAYLLEALRPFCDEAAKERNTMVGTVRSQVEIEVQKLLPHGKAQKSAVARALAMSPRTLARRLAEEGTSYEEVVDRLRRSLALQYIKERGLSLSQIAWLLGYEESTSLNHAFKRWLGQSPSEVRRSRPNAPSATAP